MPEATYQTLRNGWYHTADLFRMDDEGGVWFVDRHADYIRRRGENISSQEVEKVVLEHPAIHEAACIGVKSPEGEDEIKICIALRAGASVDPAELVSFLRPRMATFMVPRYIQIYDELPKTPATHRVRKAELRGEAINEQTWDAGSSRQKKHA
jgi:crotonobetaine/carnitine-CoA ligase